MKPVQKHRTASLVAEQIKHFMEEHQLKPGDRLPTERELTEMLRVGRTSLREGLRLLEADGLIEVKAGEGIFAGRLSVDYFLRPVSVSSLLRISERETLELLHLRKVIEAEAASLAATHAKASECRTLEKIAARIGECITDGAKFIPNDVAFHIALVRASGNSVFSRFYMAVIDMLVAQERLTVQVPGVMKRAYEDHLAIASAIASRNPRLAYEEVVKHLDGVAQAYEKASRSAIDLTGSGGSGT
ncbi:MAG: FadR family transcriptional regulator [Firmicutes bacterium]|jgi:GntR family transcriptional repressor for pyruvate dehydrogenase complex|nr:FadR family transcriptional regulator [Bacillota bacterium]MDH7496477.1 FadR/GntR family transcriptional regulator [Bacillota bacterium]